MPASTRWNVKRNFDQTILHINTASEILVKLGAQFEHDHPDIFEELSPLVVVLEGMKEWLAKMRDRV